MTIDRKDAEAREWAEKATAYAIETAYPGVSGRLRDLEMTVYAANQSARFSARALDGDDVQERAFAHVAHQAAARAVGHTAARIDAVVSRGERPDDSGNPHAG